MPRVKIKQLDERTATAGLHMGGGPERRKLHPGEIIEIPEGELFDTLWATGKLELTMDPVTRPLDFLNAREAAITSPTFKSRGPDEDREIEKAWADIEARMSESSKVQPQAESPADDSPPEPTVESGPAEPPAKPRNRRAARRAKAKAAQHGQEATA